MCPVLRKARVGDLCVICYGRNLFFENPRVGGGTGEKLRASGDNGPESWELGQVLSSGSQSRLRDSELLKADVGQSERETSLDIGKGLSSGPG